jgi:acyl-CoA thioesterase YciA
MGQRRGGSNGTTHAASVGENPRMHSFTPMLAPAQLLDSQGRGAELVMRVMPLPADTNGNGDIFGGWLMAQVDLAGAVLPARIARGRLATVAVNQFLFKQPVSVGDLLSFYARVERIGTTSVTVHVEVLAERDPANPQIVKVTEANLTYVAIDRDGRPRHIPKDCRD